MSGRFFELAIRARRLVRRTQRRLASRPHGRRLTGRRQLGELTQFSFRLAFAIDVAYIGMGAAGGAALSRASRATPPAVESSLTCESRADSASSLFVRPLR